MRLNKIMMIILTCIISVLLIPAIVYSQAAQPQQQPAESKEVKKRVHPREAYPPDQRPEENYLARFKAIEISQDLMQSNLENIYMLKVIVTNFKEQGWEKEYQDIYEEYKAAVSKYYRRQVIYSRLELERNKKNISNLYKKIVTVYEDQAQTLLEDCADKILNFDLDEKNKYDPNRSRVLFQNQMRLWIAYGQVDDAERASIDNLHKTSVYHLRIAKSYAISILEELDPQGSSGDKFKVHKADNLNRIFITTAAAPSTSGPTSKN